MSGLNTSWGVQEQNERIISALAWLIVVIMLFYASVFMYKRVASPQSVVTPGNVAQGTGHSGTSVLPDDGSQSSTIKGPVFSVDTTHDSGASADDGSENTDDYSSSVDDDASSSDDTTNGSSVVVHTITADELPVKDTADDSQDTVVPTVDDTYDDSGVASESLFTIRLGDFDNEAQAIQAARKLPILRAYSYKPVVNPYNRRVYLQVGKFRDPRAAQVALLSVRNSAPTLPTSVIPLQETPVSTVSVISPDDDTDDTDSGNTDGDIGSDDISNEDTQATAVDTGLTHNDAIDDDSGNELPLSDSQGQTTFSQNVSDSSQIVSATDPINDVVTGQPDSPSTRTYPQDTHTEPTQVAAPTVVNNTSDSSQFITGVTADDGLAGSFVRSNDEYIGVNPDYAPGSDLGPRPPKGYSVQVGSFSSRNNAVAYRKALSGAGFTCYIFKTTRDNVDWYRVQLGNFGNKDDAAKLLNTFEAKYEQPAIVILRK